MDAAFEKKLRDNMDRQEIWEAMKRYARGVDRCDRELIRSAYWPDAVDDHGDFVGTSEQFIDWVTNAMGNFAASFHGLLNHTSELAGDDAYCETYFLAISARPEPPHLMTPGRYIDHFQRRNGEWRIFKRIMVIESGFEIDENAFATAIRTGRKPGDRLMSTQDRSDISYDRPLKPRQPTAA